MLTFLKRNLFIIALFLITLAVTFVTFLTFIDKSFIKLNDQNLKFLLFANIFLLLAFFITYLFYNKIYKIILLYQFYLNIS